MALCFLIRIFYCWMSLSISFFGLRFCIPPSLSALSVALCSILSLRAPLNHSLSPLPLLFYVSVADVVVMIIR